MMKRLIFQLSVLISLLNATIPSMKKHELVYLGDIYSILEQKLPTTELVTVGTICVEFLFFIHIKSVSV